MTALPSAVPPGCAIWGREEPSGPSPGGRTAWREQRPYVTATRPDDERLQLQLPLLPDAAGSRDAADSPQAGGARASVSRRASPRLVRGAVHYHGDPGASGERDGRSDPGARAAAVE